MNLFLSLHSAWTIGRIRAVSARFPFGRFTQPPLSDPEGAPFEQYRAQTDRQHNSACVGGFDGCWRSTDAGRLKQRMAAASGRPHGRGDLENAAHRAPGGMWVFRYVVKSV